MKINCLKILFYTSIALVFLPIWVIYFSPKSGANIYVGFFFWILLYFFCLIGNKDKFLFFIRQIIKTPIFKYYFFFMLFLLLTSIGHYVLGFYKAEVSYYVVRIYKFLIASIAVLFLPVLAAFINIKTKNIVRFLYSVIFIIFSLSIVQYIAFLFNITPLHFLFDFFTNGRESMYLNPDFVKEELRVYSIFNEPSVLGKFIFIFMPIIMCLSKTKYKLFENKYLNFTVKNSIIPLMLINIILTKSPIAFLFCFSEFILVYYQFF